MKYKLLSLLSISLFWGCGESGSDEIISTKPPIILLNQNEITQLVKKLNDKSTGISVIEKFVIHATKLSLRTGIDSDSLLEALSKKIEISCNTNEECSFKEKE